MTEFLNELTKLNIPAWVLLLVAGGLLIYATAAIWTQLSVGRLLWQNLFRANRVELPGLGKPAPVLAAGTGEEESTALVLSRSRTPVNPDQPAPRDFSNVIYPVAGRNGLHFAPERCTGCGLCVYTCPTAAVTTSEDDMGYVRRFNLAACVYCGLCESACPTSAIRLTFNPAPARLTPAALLVEGHIEATACPLCKLKAPKADLLAERIYVFSEDNDTSEDEPDEEAATSHRRAINPAGVCLECQKRVIEAEERICG